MSEIAEILNGATSIAVVGASGNATKAAHIVPADMQRAGYRILPVNPRTETLFGVTAYASLSDLPETPDIVNVFRPAAEAPEVARQAVACGARVLWLQLGIRSEEARAIAQDAGILYIEDRCIMVERRRAEAHPPA